MATKSPRKFVSPANTTREAEAAKTTRLRALRLAKEAEDTAAAKEAATRAAAAKLVKPGTRRRAATAVPAIQPAAG
jgi:hypothetical protein